ncbi:hypothetical protein EDB85DRAFT_1890399 [Lactarius pseudohatsudake]|nr:hypothetical protein EDB85DRAFT_1890399 [Lactarius pseudohatsudake]
MAKAIKAAAAMRRQPQQPRRKDDHSGDDDDDDEDNHDSSGVGDSGGDEGSGQEGNWLVIQYYTCVPIPVVNTKPVNPETPDLHLQDPGYGPRQPLGQSEFSDSSQPQVNHKAELSRLE